MSERDFEATPEQLDIFEHVEHTDYNLLIEARAGSGKTTTILEALAHIKATSTLLCAFNKRIATEMELRLPPIPPSRGVVVKTLHSLGLTALRSYYPHLQVDEDATQHLITDAAEQILSHEGVGSFPMPSRRAAVRLLTTLKETQTAANLSRKQIRHIGGEYDIYGKLGSGDADFVDQVVELAYLSSQNFKKRKTIDFCDMVWGPVVTKMQLRSRYKAICVDEAQDVSAPQFEMIKMTLVPGGRLILVGDPMQGIYAWRGAIGDLVWRSMNKDFEAHVLPLTMTWRCPRSVVRLANELVPDLQARPDADEGEVKDLEFEHLSAELRGLREPAFVLSRTNEMLLRVALELWRRGVRFSLNGGREIIEPLFWVIEKLNQTSVKAFQDSAQRWHEAEQKKAELAQSSAWSDRAAQQYGMLTVALDYAGHPGKIGGLLRDVLGFERKTTITLSSVHKVKGLEADHVYLLKETFARHRKGKPCFTCQGSGMITEKYSEGPCGACGGSGQWRPEPPQEELNIEYVAITRAKKTLTWVTFPENALTQILRQRQAEQAARLIEEASLDALDHVPDDEHKDALAAEALYGKGSTIMLDGSISQPGDDGRSHRIVDPRKRL